MVTEYPKVCDVSEVPVGLLFYLVSEGRNSALCLSAEVTNQQGDKEPRIVPIRWKGSENAELCPLQIGYVHGAAIILDDAKFEICLSNSAYQAGAYVAEGSLFILLENAGHTYGNPYVNASTGQIVAAVPEPRVGICKWTVTVPKAVDRRDLFVGPWREEGSSV
jgi:hypothetical protein